MCTRIFICHNMGGVDSVWVLDARSLETIAEKHYTPVRNNTQCGIPRAFAKLLQQGSGNGSFSPSPSPAGFSYSPDQVASRARTLPPVVAMPSSYLSHFVSGGVVLLATHGGETNPLAVREWMRASADAIAEYVGRDATGGVDGNGVRDHFVMVYLLLEELAESGLPWRTDVAQLKSVLPPPTLGDKMLRALSGGGVAATSTSGSATTSSPATPAAKAAAAARGMANVAQGMFAKARARVSGGGGTPTHVPLQPTTPPFTPPPMRTMMSSGTPPVPNSHSPYMGNGSSPPQPSFGAAEADNAPPWRPRAPRYASNEVFVDIVEELDAELDSEGKCVRSSVIGELFVTSRLSGASPELVVRLSDTRVIDDTSVRFHPSVRTARWTSERMLNLVPPDGTSKIMTYATRDPAGPASRAARGQKATSAVGGWHLPIYVKPVMSWDGTTATGKVSVMVGERPKHPQGQQGHQQGHAAKTCDRVSVRVPIPKKCERVEFNANVGTVTCDMTLGVVLWNIGKIPYDKAPCLNGLYTMAGGGGGGGGGEASSPPPLSSGCIAASFSLHGETATGLCVESISVPNEMYKIFKAFKATLKGGRFHVRLA